MKIRALNWRRNSDGSLSVDDIKTRVSGLIKDGELEIIVFGELFRTTYFLEEAAIKQAQIFYEKRVSELFLTDIDSEQWAERRLWELLSIAKEYRKIAMLAVSKNVKKKQLEERLNFFLREVGLKL